MASKRELIEAHDFNRRRLVNAFISGAPKGREVESTSRTKPVVGGIVLAAFLIGSSAIYGLVRPRVPEAWDQNTVVLAKDSAAMYVALQGTLYPVPNTTSARLAISEGAGYRVVSIDDNLIAEAPRGDVIGIVGAPTDLPKAENLVQDHWIGCMAGDGTPRVKISPQPAPQPDTEHAVLLRDPEKEVWLATNGRRYKIPAGPAVSRLQSALRLDEPVNASPAFLTLVPEGSTLTMTMPKSDAKPAEGLLIDGKPATVGMLIHSPTEGLDWLIDESFSLVRLTPFQAAVFRAQHHQGPYAETTASALSLPAGDPRGGADWPANRPTAPEGRQPCAVLTMAEDAPPTVSTVFVEPGDPAFATNAPPVSVAGGTGSLVVASTTGAPMTTMVESTAGPVDQGAVTRTADTAPVTGGTATWYLVDQTGQIFPLAKDDPNDLVATVGRLGFDPAAARGVPNAWVNSFPHGPNLSTKAVLRRLTNIQQPAPATATPHASGGASPSAGATP